MYKLRKTQESYDRYGYQSNPAPLQPSQQVNVP